MSNIFTLSSGLTEEDRFTGSLHYVVDSFPHIGQALSNYLLSSSGLEKSPFFRSTDHPTGTKEDRPDFLLECEHVDIVCEHKINSPLGKRQLERYLALPRSKPFVVALISNGICDVPSSVIEHKDYICPVDSNVPHFTWQSIYPLIEAKGNRLVSDFLEYMRSMSMKPITCESWQGLFDHDDVAEAFGQQWQETRAYFKSLGASCRLDPSKKGLQISEPSDWLHLMYLFVSPNAEPRHDQVEGPYLGARIYISREKFPTLHFQNLTDEFDSQVGIISPRPRGSAARWGSRLEFVSDYHTSLDSILTTNTDVLKRRLQGFSMAVHSHAVANVVTT